MFIDMVGYSAIAQRDEALALRLVEEQKGLLSPVFGKHQGRVIKETGDGFLVEFGSALQAARCAMEAQSVLRSHNAVVEPANQIHIRIGLHVADVVHTEGDILGDGVNLAARIEPMADRDGICLTEDVARQITGKITEAIEKVGPRRLKNIERPVTVYRIRLPWTSSRRRNWPPLRVATAGSLLLTAFIAGFLAGRYARSPSRGMRHALMVNNVSFSPDGRLLLSASEDKTVRLWDVSSRQSIATLVGHTRAVDAAVFSPDGKTIASAGMDHTVRIWDPATGHPVRVLPDSGHRGHSRPVQTVTFSPDGRVLASGGEDGKIILWEIATGSVVKTLTGHSDAVWSVAFSPDGKSLASGSSDETIRIWDVVTGRATKTLRGHSYAVTGVAFIPKTNWLASSSWDESVKLWDVGSGTEVRSMAVHSDAVNAVAASPDGTMLVSGGDDGTVRAWEVATGRELPKVATSESAVMGVAWSRTGVVAWGSHDGTVGMQKAPLGP